MGKGCLPVRIENSVWLIIQRLMSLEQISNVAYDFPQVTLGRAWNGNRSLAEGPISCQKKSGGLLKS